MILLDTSAWVEYDRATGSTVDNAVTDLIRDGGKQLASTEPVLMEVLAGAKDDIRYGSLHRLVTSFQWVPVDPIADFTGAAKIYRSCHDKGFTPRGLLDCMIANIAMRSGSQLLASDRDFVEMAAVVPLRLAEPRR